MRRALMSVFDKTGLVEFAATVRAQGFRILSTGGTQKALAVAGIEADDVSGYTGFPEIMGGRVKTLHPKIHGGILSVRGDPEHDRAMARHEMDPIDLVVVNLYPFRETVKKRAATRAEIVENIDIGGPAMIRSAAKNHDHVVVVVDPEDYGWLLKELKDHGGHVPEPMRRRLALKAFRHTADYDAAVAAYFASDLVEDRAFPDVLSIQAQKVAELRYGENPHQKAAFYRYPETETPSVAAAQQVGGKELSYNNLMDVDAGWGLVQEFGHAACAIIKHTNPCGCASAENLASAFDLALASDPVSAYGGVVVVNRPVDAETASVMRAEGTFVEVIVAPAFTADAAELLKGAKWGKNVRLVRTGGLEAQGQREWSLRSVSGGLLVQTADRPGASDPDFRAVTKRSPTEAELEDLMFAWRVVKHVKSNAIVLARGKATVGVGAGQMSRVDSVEISVRKAGARAEGSVLASDAFFPFEDGVKAAAAAGVMAVIQPGGSKRDPEVIAAANDADMAMVMTGVRHFRH